MLLFNQNSLLFHLLESCRSWRSAQFGNKKRSKKERSVVRCAKEITKSIVDKKSPFRKLCLYTSNKHHQQLAPYNQIKSIAWKSMFENNITPTVLAVSRNIHTAMHYGIEIVSNSRRQRRQRRLHTHNLKLKNTFSRSETIDIYSS